MCKSIKGLTREGEKGITEPPKVDVEESDNVNERDESNGDEGISVDKRI
jgi:hypothetical protein